MTAVLGVFSVSNNHLCAGAFRIGDDQALEAKLFELEYIDDAGTKITIFDVSKALNGLLIPVKNSTYEKALDFMKSAEKSRSYEHNPRNAGKTYEKYGHPIVGTSCSHIICDEMLKDALGIDMRHIPDLFDISADERIHARAFYEALSDKASKLKTSEEVSSEFVHSCHYPNLPIMLVSAKGPHLIVPSQIDAAIRHVAASEKTIEPALLAAQMQANAGEGRTP